MPDGRQVKVTPEDRRNRVGALPNLVIIGAMKCGTSALHAYLGRHPEIFMSEPKELNFFFAPVCGPAGPAAGGAPRRDDAVDGKVWAAGNWDRGPGWYAGHFAPGARVRGESSPGYTSPDHAGVARRMAALVPKARLVYLVRDPLARAVSQYIHHRTQGTEGRPLTEALLDPNSQYMARGRYYERLAPFLEVFGRERITIVAQEELRTERRTTLRWLFELLGVEDGFWSADLDHPVAARGDGPALGRRLRKRLEDAFVDDAVRLRELAGRDFPSWSS